MLTQKRLKRAGYCAVVNAFSSAIVAASFPVTIMVLSPSYVDEANIKTIIAVACAFAIFCEGLTYLYVFFTLKLLIEQRCSLSKTNRFISVFILVNILTALFSLGNSASGGMAIVLLLFESLNYASGLDIATIFLISNFLSFPLGITYAVFGIKLLNLPGRLSRMLKPFSYLTIATGACIGTVVFLPVGVLTSMMSEIILASIFFRAAEKNVT